MTSTVLNEMTGALARVLQKRRLEPKIILAPTRRVGRQWLDAATLAGAPAFNARVTTMAGLALELASAELGRQGMSYLAGARQEALAAEIFSRLQDKGHDYLASLEPGPGVYGALLSTLLDLRMAGVGSFRLNPAAFEVQDKGREVLDALSEYESELDRQKLADYADVLAMASERVRVEDDVLGEGAVVIMPADDAERLTGLEKKLWQSIPQGTRATLPVDRPGSARPDAGSDASLLSWIGEPSRAPAARGDGSASIFSAAGETNEVRAVFRRVLAEGVPFDQVEIVHTDYGAYVPRLFETASLLAAGESGEIPATFAEGIPARYARPARALSAWARWIKDGYPQSSLARMIGEGLLIAEAAESGSAGYSALAAALRPLPIGLGRDSYQPIIEREIDALSARIKRSRKIGALEDDSPSSDSLKRRLAALKGLADLAERLMGFSPGPGDGQGRILSKAAEMAEAMARSANRLDEYVLHAMQRRLREMAEVLEEGDVPGFDALSWIEELPDGMSAEGLGPRPGRVHVSSLRGGGHSGRPCLFVIGLDEGRFPGAGLQDPIILDEERGNLSSALPTAAGRVRRGAEDLVRLLCRSRGKVCLSYPSSSVEDGRDNFPGLFLINAYRILSGRRDGALEDMAAWLGPPESFSASSGEGAALAHEWWTWRLAGKNKPSNAEEIAALCFPNLGRGKLAREARRSSAFTEYDGRVEAAGVDLDPFLPGGMTLSSSGLELLARCPMEFFFRYALEISLPEDYEPDPFSWLDAGEKGGLLHEAFRRFVDRLEKNGLSPRKERDLPELIRVVDELIELEKADNPPPNPEALERDRAELHLAAGIFAAEEEECRRSSRPCFLEASIGLPPVGDGTPLDSRSPVEIELPSGGRVRVRGRIDRVDSDLGSIGAGYSVVDYKTGSPYKFKIAPPFNCGRSLQGALYLAMLQARLDETFPGAEADGFSYLFTGPKGYGERLGWKAEDLLRGREIIEDLCSMIASGTFPFTSEVDDVKFTDYGAAFGPEAEMEERARSVLAKMASDPRLAAFARLRAKEEGKR